MLDIWFSLTCQAGKDEDRKGFCAVYSSLIRVAGAANTGTPPEYDYDYGPWPIEDADMEKAEKKCLNACKKNRKGNNSHKEARNQLCKAYGLKSLQITKVSIRAKVNHAIEKDNNTIENLQIQADNQQRECDQEAVQGNATDFYYNFFLTRVGNTFMTNITLMFEH